MKAIVYTSNTGSTKKYAEMLGRELHIPIYTLKEASRYVNPHDDIIYMGWILGGMIHKFRKATQKYEVKVVCAVGMNACVETTEQELTDKNELSEEKLFYLQGGLQLTELRGIYKFMMKAATGAMKTELLTKENRTEEEKKILDMIENGGDCVKKENLNDVITFLTGERKYQE